MMHPAKRLVAGARTPSSHEAMSALSRPDPQLEQIRHAFGGAFRRMRAAETETELVSELSNQLHQLYRLGELCRKRQRLTKPAFYGVQGVLTTTADLAPANLTTEH